MVERSPLPEGSEYLDASEVRLFAESALVAVGLGAGDAASVADVLVTADIRGIRSHGVARLPYFLSRLQRGELNARPRLAFAQRSATTAVLDADRAVGIVASRAAMERAMAMADTHGSGFVAVTGSSHFGYAGYWTALAQRRGFIGIAMSNGGGRTAPTFAVEGMLGTNPLSVAIPGSDSTAFCLDMATSMVAAGKIETALRDGREVPAGWLHRDAGRPSLDDRGKLRPGFPLLPLGGEGDETGGHKGYALALMVELLCGAVAGSALPARLGESAAAATSVGHFFGCLQLAGFRDPAEVAADSDATFDAIRNARKAPGHDRIFIPGEPEAIAEQVSARLGVAIDPEVSRQLHRWAGELGLDPWRGHRELAAD